jgi:thiamine biosynthesis lipoprotein
VEPLRRLVDYRKIELDEKRRRVRIGRDQKLGLGGIAKGYIVDQTVAVLKKAGLSSFLVRAGGDLYGAGKKPNGEPWVSGIQDPRGKSGQYFALVQLEDHAFSTAGDYARAYEYQGKRYHHILDPKTGFPATRSRSVTVWARSALLADAVDDAVFILGPKEGLELVESLEGVGVVIVDADNRVWTSERLRNQVELLSDPSN